MHILCDFNVSLGFGSLANTRHKMRRNVISTIYLYRREKERKIFCIYETDWRDELSGLLKENPTAKPVPLQSLSLSLYIFFIWNFLQHNIEFFFLKTIFYFPFLFLLILFFFFFSFYATYFILFILQIFCPFAFFKSHYFICYNSFFSVYT